MLTLANFSTPQVSTPTPFSKFSKLKRTAMTVASQLESEEEEIATSTSRNFTLSVTTLATHTHASRLNMTGESFNLLLIHSILCNFRGTLALTYLYLS